MYASASGEIRRYPSEHEIRLSRCINIDDLPCTFGTRLRQRAMLVVCQDHPSLGVFQDIGSGVLEDKGGQAAHMLSRPLIPLRCWQSCAGRGRTIRQFFLPAATSGEECLRHAIRQAIQHVIGPRFSLCLDGEPCRDMF